MSRTPEELLRMVECRAAAAEVEALRRERDDYLAKWRALSGVAEAAKAYQRRRDSAGPGWDYESTRLFDSLMLAASLLDPAALASETKCSGHDCSPATCDADIKCGIEIEPEEGEDRDG